jgi:predicted SAM-dependent methyltransferase
MQNLDLYYYRKYNKDLEALDDNFLKYHYVTYGQHENRIINLDTFIKKNEHCIYFDLEYYKRNNKDLKFNTDEEYVIDYTKNRLNDNREISLELTAFKTHKRQKIQQLIKDELRMVTNMNFLSEDEKKKFQIGSNETESGNEWPEGGDIEKLIQQNKLVLNVGAGYRKSPKRYYDCDNVINTEIFPYPTTDVVCNGDNLPFKDNSFDVVLSLAVLEHVPNPWVHAEELIRVLKPGGIIYADVPFLQPYHGYPYHYFNMTTAGLKSLFEKKITVVKHTVERWSKPIFTLTWFLQRYCDFLDEPTRNKFQNMTVRQIIQNGNNIELDYVKNMIPEKEEIIAAGTTLIGRKK